MKNTKTGESFYNNLRRNSGGRKFCVLVEFTHTQCKTAYLFSCRKTAKLFMENYGKQWLPANTTITLA